MDRICLVVNNTDREIQVGEYWKKYLPAFNDTVVTPLLRVVNISSKGCANIKPAEFIKRCDELKRTHNADRRQWVFLSDDMENGVVLSKEDIQDKRGFVIMIKNKKLVKEPVSKESAGTRNESEEELKVRLISIVENRLNVSGQSQGGNVENGEQIGQGTASFCPSQARNGENFGQNSASAGTNNASARTDNASARPSR